MTKFDSQRHRTEENLAFFNSELFKTVQMSELFSDSKIFADAQPKQTYSDILVAYPLECPNSSKKALSMFIQNHFSLPKVQVSEPVALHMDIEQQIKNLWQHLERQPDKQSSGSLLPLQSIYVVPGGRFREIYYWDSYFTALGLIESGLVDVVEGMLQNFIELQQQYGNIPNGNRSYYLSRSQPPILAMLVELLLPLQTDPQKFIAKTITAVINEYKFWMTGNEQLTSDNNEFMRVVRMPDGSILNRYWDNEESPRPESFCEDIELSKGMAPHEKSRFYRNVRAACESGWDFSSRWLNDGKSLTSIKTTRILPVDLNCLLYKVELLIADFHQTLQNEQQSLKFIKFAEQRKTAMNRYFWSAEANYFLDYDIDKNTQSPVKSLAGVLPLFIELANDSQANSIVETIKDSFLKVGGLVTTDVDSPQQWDSPNGWAPLQWFAVKGLLNYKHDSLAENIMLRWLDTVNLYFEQTGKLMEKYNVCEQNCAAGGGEYEVQEGFGWTNGVYLAFLKELNEIN
jgi:alpha,alpha-trehalase